MRYKSNVKSWLDTHLFRLGRHAGFPMSSQNSEMIFQPYSSVNTDWFNNRRCFSRHNETKIPAEHSPQLAKLPKHVDGSVDVVDVKTNVLSLKHALICFQIHSREQFEFIHFQNSICEVINPCLYPVTPPVNLTLTIPK